MQIKIAYFRNHDEIKFIHVPDSENPKQVAYECLSEELAEGVSCEPSNWNLRIYLFELREI